jgi:hypothetical protein
MRYPIPDPAGVSNHDLVEYLEEAITYYADGLTPQDADELHDLVEAYKGEVIYRLEQCNPDPPAKLPKWFRP